jgi:cobalt/nickel transport system ATP-binding protein
MSDELMLEVQSVRYCHDHGVPALNNASLRIKKGVKLALLGNNGAGKTTLFLHLVGILRPASGQILLDGKPVEYSRAFLGKWRQRVGLLLQDPEDQLFSANVEQDVSFGPMALGLPESEVRGIVRQALDDMGVLDLLNRPVHLLSHGQKKRVALAGVLAISPQMIIMDEPTAGLDHPGQKQLMAVLDRLHKGGSGMVFSTHDINLARKWADEVAVMDGGQVVCHGSAAKVLEDSNITELLGIQ